MNKRDAIEAIIDASHKLRVTGLIHYAASYAKAAREMEGYEWRVQCLYILNNLSGWRGEKAKEVKEFLKAESKGKAS